MRCSLSPSRISPNVHTKHSNEIYKNSHILPFSPLPRSSTDDFDSPMSRCSNLHTQKSIICRAKKHINHKSEREWSCILWMENEQTNERRKKKLEAPPNKSTQAINISFCKLGWCEPRQRGVKISIKFAEYHLWVICYFVRSACLKMYSFFATEFLQRNSIIQMISARISRQNDTKFLKVMKCGVEMFSPFLSINSVVGVTTTAPQTFVDRRSFHGATTTTQTLCCVRTLMTLNFLCQINVQIYCYNLMLPNSIISLNDLTSKSI